MAVFQRREVTVVHGSLVPQGLGHPCRSVRQRTSTTGPSGRRRISALSSSPELARQLAEPSLARAFDRCVERGAQKIVIHPYFLLPGRHSTEDVPRLAAEAGARHPTVTWTVSEPLGLHSGILEAVEHRVRRAFARRR